MVQDHGLFMRFACAKGIILCKLHNAARRLTSTARQSQNGVCKALAADSIRHPSNELDFFLIGSRLDYMCHHNLGGKLPWHIINK